jgi:DNA-binding winged helix-turn-helix (wHTH) protein/TolB-like protein
MPLKTGLFYEYGPFQLEPGEHRLTRDGVAVPLSPKAFELLVYLVKNPGRLLTKEELLRGVWPDSFVEDANLTVAISTIRKALGEKEGGLRYVETVPTKGYRFIASVKEVKPVQIVAVADGEPLPPPAAPLPAGSDNSDACPALSESEAENATADVSVTPAPLVTSSKSLVRLVPWGIGVLGLLLALGVYLTRHATRPPPLPAAAQHTLAVLPLRNIKQSPADDYLSFSLADAVITELAPVSSLTVRPSSAIEKYKGQTIDVRKVASDLHVDTLLTGTFIHEGDDVRITYQLIDVKTDKILGRDRIDLKYDRLTTVQDLVAHRVVQGLALSLPSSEAAQLHAPGSLDALAYEYYLRGVDRLASHDFPTAVEMLERSTQIDPGYAPAWAYLGQAYNSRASFQLGGREQYEKAKEAFQRALLLQPKQVEARIFLANFLIDTGQVEKAVPLLRDAEHDSPTNASVHWELGYAYRFAGMLQESLAECRYARQIDPQVKGNGALLNTLLYLGEYHDFLADLPTSSDSSFLTFYRGFGEYHQKRSELAARDFDRAWQLEQTLYSQTGEAFSDAIAKRPSDGLALLHDLERKIKQQDVGDPEGTYKMAEAYAVLGDKESALRVLGYTIDHGFFSWPYFRSDPLLANIREEPHFALLMEVARRRHEAFRRQFF